MWNFYHQYLWSRIVMKLFCRITFIYKNIGVISRPYCQRPCSAFLAAMSLFYQGRKGCLIIDRWDADNVQRHVSRNNFSAIIIRDRCIHEPIYISVWPRRSLVYLAKERSYEKSDRNYFRLAKPSRERWENGNSLSLPWHCSISIRAFILFFLTICFSLSPFQMTIVRYTFTLIYMYIHHGSFYEMFRVNSNVQFSNR